MRTKRKLCMAGLLLVATPLIPPSLAQSDTEPPVLTDFDFNPKSVDVTTAPATVTCTMSFTDSPAGVQETRCAFWNPSRTLNYGCTGGLSSGDIYDGTWTCDLTIPQYSEEGIYEIAEVFARDAASTEALSRMWSEGTDDILREIAEKDPEQLVRYAAQKLLYERRVEQAHKAPGADR